MPSLPIPTNTSTNTNTSTSTSTSSVHQLLQDRGKDYGAEQGWVLTSRMLSAVPPGVPLWDSPFVWPWFQILGKLCRALYSPTKKDHWNDIVGYATLVLTYLDDHSIQEQT